MKIENKVSFLFALIDENGEKTDLQESFIRGTTLFFSYTNHKIKI